jgi:hypothetical protein
MIHRTQSARRGRRLRPRRGTDRCGPVRLRRRRRLCKDLSTRPISRAAELVEVIPGMIATEHSSGGKANQYFLRGFNLDHGTDFGWLRRRRADQPALAPAHERLSRPQLPDGRSRRARRIQEGRAVRREWRLHVGRLRLLRSLRQAARTTTSSCASTPRANMRCSAAGSWTYRRGHAPGGRVARRRRWLVRPARQARQERPSM